MIFASPSRFFGAVAVALLLGLVTFARAATGAAPQVSVSLRGVTADTLEQGEPWRVAVRLDVARGSKEMFVLAPTSGSWAEALAVELVAVSGQTVAARAEPVGKSDSATATLDAKHVAGGLWRFSPKSMQAVAPGNYVLRVQLKITEGGGWTGTAKAREVPLKLVAPSGQPSVSRIVNRAQEALLLDQIQEAATLVDAALKTMPREPALLRVWALIAERAGNPFAATLCLNAVNFSSANKLTGPPPAEDIELLARLEKSRKSAVASSSPLPAWSWPPMEVLAALTEDAKKSSFIPALPTNRSGGGDSKVAIAAVPTSPVVPVVAPASPVAAPIPGASSQPTPAVPLIEHGELVPAKELSDAKINADANGHWATSARASSAYSNPGYAAAKATGAPDATAGDNPLAWCPAKNNDGFEWLEVGFAQPLHATEVRVRQNNSPGAIAKLEVMEPDGTVHVWWEGADSSKPSAGSEVVWFAVRVAKTDYLVAQVKITLNLSTVPGWKQIDAVQLVGSEGR